MRERLEQEPVCLQHPAAPLLVCVPPPQAHKALLATQSDYFRVMFTADMRERDQDKIHMKGLTAAGFGHILRFMYYGSLELSMPTVQEILQVEPHTLTRPPPAVLLCSFSSQD